MDKIVIAKLLLRQREQGIKFSNFMPKALWIKVFTVWFVLSILAILFTYFYPPVGMLLFGWVLSQMYLVFGMIRKSSRHWELYTKDMMDWEKVERIAGEGRCD